MNIQTFLAEHLGVESTTEDIAKFLEDFDELSGKQAAYIVRNFDLKTECYHLDVEIHTCLSARETYLQPAEYEQKAYCKDCGDWLDVEDVPSVADRMDA